jgi:CO/xanthine dehydrogenase Mo-binding subunit
MQSIPQLVAHALGIPVGSIVVRQADTDAAGYDVGVGGGRQTVSIGAASMSACVELRTKMLKVASDMLEASTEDLVLENGYVSINGVPGSGVTVAEVAAHAQKIVGPLAGSGSVTGKGVKAEPGCARGHFIEAVDIPIFAVHDCEVAVDPGTGHVEVLSYTVVQDVGRALNPRAIQGQVQGGVVQGLGYALHEEMTIDENGRVRQDGLETYRLPLAQDVLPVRMDLYEGAPSMGPFGIKGAGEVPILNVAAAVACAVSNAIGRPVQQLPLTPPRVLSLLLDRERPVKHRHIAPNWRDNVLKPAL